jgi:hypothetical protein
VNTHTACPRQYYYHYNGFEPAEQDTEAMDVGSLVHNAIDTALTHDDVGRAKLELLNDDSYPQYTRTKALKIFAAYFPHIQHDLGFVGVHSTEMKLDFKLPSGLRVVGYVDAIFENADGSYTVVDWKVRAYAKPDHVAAIDAQLHVYAYGLSKLFPDLNISSVEQIQLVHRNLPGTLKVSKGRPVLSAKTTLRRFSDVMREQGYDPMEYVAAFADKIVPVDHFIKRTSADPSMTANIIKWFEHRAYQALTDTDYLPTHNAYVCDRCAYIQHCTRSAKPSNG